MKALIALLVALPLAATSLTGCKKESATENRIEDIGEGMQENMEDAGDAMEEAGEDAADAVEDAVE